MGLATALMKQNEGNFQIYNGRKFNNVQYFTLREGIVNISLNFKLVLISCLAI